MKDFIIRMIGVIGVLFGSVIATVGMLMGAGATDIRIPLIGFVATIVGIGIAFKASMMGLYK